MALAQSVEAKQKVETGRICFLCLTGTLIFSFLWTWIQCRTFIIDSPGSCPLDLGWNYTIGSFTSPDCWLQLLCLLSLHNYMIQFFIISLPVSFSLSYFCSMVQYKKFLRIKIFPRGGVFNEVMSNL